MPKKQKVSMNDMILLFMGILLSFMLQLLYDVLREEPFYQSIMSASYWRAFLTVICAIIIYLMLRYWKKQDALP
jgi:hypothetical protein